MSLFDRLVSQALQARPELTAVKAVVEKELLHHDILREMSAAGLLGGLTFIGGTCLRTCYGSVRLSEDIDFTGGADFTRGMLAGLAVIDIDLRDVGEDDEELRADLRGQDGGGEVLVDDGLDPLVVLVLLADDRDPGRYS